MWNAHQIVTVPRVRSAAQKVFVKLLQIQAVLQKIQTTNVDLLKYAPAVFVRLVTKERWRNAAIIVVSNVIVQIQANVRAIHRLAITAGALNVNQMLCLSVKLMRYVRIMFVRPVQITKLDRKVEILARLHQARAVLQKMHLECAPEIPLTVIMEDVWSVKL